MVDLRPWRVPVAMVLLAAMAVRVGASLVSVAIAAAHQSGLLTALTRAGVGSGEIALSVALAAVCWWCATDQVRGARGLATTSFVLVVIQVVLSVGALVAVLPLMSARDGLPLIGFLVQLTWLVVPILAAAVLLRCARGPGREAREISGTAASQPPPEQSAVTTGGDDETGKSFPEPAGWAPDEAAGAAWTSAGEAAKGGSVAGWGSSTGSSWELAEWTPPAIRAADPGDDPPESSVEQRSG